MAGTNTEPNINKFNMILVVRNDGTTAWEGSAYKLQKGELGLEYLANGKAKLKAGAATGDKTWKELPYVGADDAQVFQTEILPVTNTQTDLEAIVVAVNGVEVHHGDIAVVKRAIGTSNKTQYTSYVYDGANWAAMDGNYDANNVYFPENVTVTTTVGYRTTSNNTPIELALAGKNLKQAYEYLYAKEDNKITVTGTSATISLSKTEDTLEVGATYTLPTASVSTGSGKYGEYGGQKADGTKIANNKNLDDVTFDLTLSYTAPGGSATQIASGTAVTSIASTTVPTDKQPATRKATDSNIVHKFNGTFKNSASAYKPITNLGNFVSALNSDSATTSPNYSDGVLGVAARTTAANMAEKTYTVKSYRKWFKGGDTATDFSVDTIKELTGSTAAVTKHTFTLKASDYAGCTRILVAIPVAANIKVTKVLLASASNADITSEFKQINTTTNVINIGGVDNYDPKSYNVWQYKPAALDSTEIYTITLG